MQYLRFEQFAISTDHSWHLSGSQAVDWTFYGRGEIVGDADSLSGNLRTSGATVVFDQASDARESGVLRGDGDLRKCGLGRLELNPLTRFDGDTFVEAGTLVARPGTFRGRIDIADGASAVFDTHEDTLLHSALSGDGAVIKTGTGTLTINQASSLSGEFTVREGRVNLFAGLPARVRIDSRAQLSGATHIAALDNAGQLAPANGIGRLQIDGDAHLRADSRLQIETAPDGRSDQLVVWGRLTLEDATLDVQPTGGGYGITSRYTIISAAQGVSGEFSSLQSDYPLLEPRLEYTQRAVELVLENRYTPFAEFATSGNQLAVAAAIDATARDAADDYAVITNAMVRSHGEQLADMLGMSGGRRARCQPAGVAGNE